MITNLVLSGGSVGTVSLLGALECLEINNKIKLKDINKYIGSSGGSIISLLLALGYTISEMTSIIKEFNVKYNNIYHFEPEESILNLIDNYGIDTGSYIVDWITNILKKKINNINPTFLEFTKATGKDLNICATNITYYRHEVFSVDHTPHVHVSDAIRASIAIPFLFTPKIINNSYYVDSGLLNNFPINYIKNTNLGGKDTLGICLLSDVDNDEISLKELALKIKEWY